MTQVVFNKEGDLLFTASKDDTINVWFSSNGERLGTYSGHNGTVWSLACDCESTETRQQDQKLTSPCSPVKAVAFWIGRQHDEAVGHQDGTVLEDLGVPDCGQAGCMEVRKTPPRSCVPTLTLIDSDDDKLALCITEQRSGYQGAIRVYEMSHEGDCKTRKSGVDKLTPFAETLRRTGRTDQPVLADRIQGDCRGVRSSRSRDYHWTRKRKGCIVRHKDGRGD